MMRCRACMLVVVTSLVVGCGGDAIEIAPLRGEDKATLAAALERAVADSAALAAATFDVPASLETSFGEDGSSVKAIETFRLTKTPGSDFAAVDRQQNIIGDRSLLESMYSFENSKGGLREDGEARFASIGFGADHRGILRDLIEGRLGLAQPVVDSLADDSAPTRVVHFYGEDTHGSLELDRATLTARRVTIRRSSSSIIGGYEYAMTLRLTDPRHTLRIPVKMRTEFDFERIATSGSGVVQLVVDTTGRIR